MRHDFEEATGLGIDLVDEYGRGRDKSTLELCRVIEGCGVRGRMFCGRFRQGLLERSLDQAQAARCDAGLYEAAVPVKIGGVTVGYFLLGPYREERDGKREWHRARHLLDRAGLTVDAALLERGLDSAVRAGPRKVEALVHLLELVVKQLTERVTAAATEASAQPVAVERACALVRAECMVQEITLEGVARRCGVSAGHLSRQFHRATGWTFREYVARVRAEAARELLRDRRRRVTEVAFEAGFQSVSQFHRVFRKVYGMAPGEMRREWQSEAV